MFPENFLKFRSDIIVKQGIINLSLHNSKVYISVVFEVTFLQKDVNAALCPLLNCVSSNTFVFHN